MIRGRKLAYRLGNVWYQASGVRSVSSANFNVDNDFDSHLHFEMMYSDKEIQTTNMHEPNTVVMLHGILGSGKNLRTVSQLLINEAAEQSEQRWQAALVDLRCHGQSTGRQGIPKPNTMSAAAHDVVKMVKSKWPDLQLAGLIGHSLGGKVALLAAQELKPKSVWTLDSWPFKDSGNGGLSSDVKRVLNIVEKVPMPLNSREELYSILDEMGLGSKMLQRWLGSSLKRIQNSKTNEEQSTRNEDRYVWSFDIQGMKELYHDYLTIDTWDILASGNINYHVVAAENNKNWNDQAKGRVVKAVEASNGRTKFHIQPNVGHWLHSEDPKGVAGLIAPYLVKNCCNH